MPFVHGFLPSRSAPLFHNGPWPSGLDLQISVAGLPSVSVDVTAMGLCGGMAFLARDVYEAATPQLRGTDSRSIPLGLGRYILSRLLDSFLGPGVIPYWLHASRELDYGTWFWGQGLYAETIDAASQVMRHIDAGALVPIGVVLAQSPWPWDVFQNHVELVYGYDLDGTRLTLHVYDSNVEGSDQVTISLDVASRAPVQPITTNGTSIQNQPGRIRGFFVLPYQRRDPSPAYVDDGSVNFVGAPAPASVAAGETVDLTVRIENAGSTTFDPALGYRLGVPSGPDSSGPPLVDVALDATLEPGRVVTQTVRLQAPADAPALRLQLLRGPAQWFGQGTDPVPITAAARIVR
jgi:hypothetical protein